MSVRKLVAELFSVGGNNVEALRVGVSPVPPFVFIVVFVRDVEQLARGVGIDGDDGVELEDSLSALVTAWAHVRLPQLSPAKIVVRIREGLNSVRTAWCDYPYGFGIEAKYDNAAYHEFHHGDWNRIGAPRVMSIADEKCAILFAYTPERLGAPKVATETFWRTNDTIVPPARS